MVKIKICGLKFEEDIEYLNTFSVDYMGFIMYPKSLRFVGDQLKELLSKVKKAKKVAVFVNPQYKEVKKVLDWGVDLIQLHGNESLEFAKKIGLEKIIKAFRIGSKFDLDILKSWETSYGLLLDTFVKGIPGGTGKTFDWKIAKSAVDLGYKIFLAGGLNIENVLSAIKEVSPYAIDIAGGLEIYPGKKDFQKIDEFFLKIKTC